MIFDQLPEEEKLRILKHNRKWLMRYPYKVKEKVHPAMLDYLNSEIVRLERQKKKAA